MNIRIEKKKPKTTIHILTKIDGYKAIDFLIDTGFTQSLAIFGDFDKIIPIYDVKNISIVPYSEWLVVADGRKVQTFKGKT
ncbi:MAG: hypothetical protein U1C97_01385, partial [Candidatus Gracilibacteria bacterium]|nr:hypothetical protein [Candidatus Gracilibacteria bacterium]